MTQLHPIDPPESAVPIYGLDPQGELSGDDPLADHPLPWPWGRDERWTKLQFAAGHILIAERRHPPWLHALLAVGLLMYLVAAPYLPIEPQTVALVFLFLGGMLYLSFAQVRGRRYFRGYLCRPEAATPDDTVPVITTERIAAILVRENTEREDDPRLVQVVLRLTDPDEYLLIGSHYYAWRKHAVQVAGQLQAWLNGQA